MTPRLDVRLRRDFVEVDDGGGYTSFSGTVEFLGAGLWQAVWPKGTAAERRLVAARGAGEDPARWGVVVRQEGSPEVVFSGPVMRCTRTEGASQGFARDSLTVGGIMDTGILAGYLGYMTPGTQVPTSAGTIATAYDTRTGPAESVLLQYLAANMGPSASIASRRITQMVLPATQGRGSTVTFKARFTNLQELARSIFARGGVGVRLVQGGPGQLLVEPVVPAVRDGLHWSVAEGTVAGTAWTWQAREATDVIAGGRDQLTDRQFVRSSAAGSWAFSRERFSAQTNVEDAADLKAAADERLAEGLVADAVLIEPGGDVTWRPFVDYDLGDEVRVSVAGQDVFERVWGLQVTHSEAGAPYWRPLVGELATQQLAGWRQEILARRLARDIAQQVRA